MHRLFRIAIVSMGLSGVLPLPSVLAQEADISSNTQALLGENNFQDCTATQTTFLQKSVFFGRVASTSNRFEACMQDKLANDYRECPSDPFAGDSTATQLDRVLRVARAPNNVRHICTHRDGPGNAWAGSLRYAHPSNVEFSWGVWLDRVVAGLPQPACATGDTPGIARCDPWPYSQAAGLTWHEAMHTHSYDHGDASDSGRAGCGFAAGSGYNMWSHSIDPGAKGLGIIALRDGKLEDTAILPTGQRARGGWRYEDEHRVLATGDFTGSGQAEIIVASDWGIGALRTDEDGGWITSAIQQNGTRIGGWAVNGSTDTAPLVGDFDGDGRDEFLIRSDWGVGVVDVGRDGMGSMTSSLAAAGDLVSCHWQAIRWTLL